MDFLFYFLSEDFDEPKKLLKFKDLPSEQKLSLMEILPNNFHLGEHVWRINNRVPSINGWAGYYWCSNNKKTCKAALTVTCGDIGQNPIAKIKTDHTCSNDRCALAIVNSKDDMIAVVKQLAVDNPAMRAPAIAMQVFKQFETLNAGNHILFFTIDETLSI